MTGFSKFIICTLLILLLTAPSTLAQESNLFPSGAAPAPVPADIQFSVSEAPQIGKELEIKIIVTSEEDINAEISCILPEGIEIVRQKGLIVMPYRHRGRPVMQEPQRVYNQALRLWIGPLKADTPQEFTFRIIILHKSTYEFIARVMGSGIWGVKETPYTITVY